MQKEKRILKVYNCFYQVSNHIYPKISLQGKWLEHLGFHPGDFIEVQLQNNQVTIKKITSMDQRPKVAIKTILEPQVYGLVQETAHTYQIKEEELFAKIVTQYVHTKQKEEHK